MLCHSLGPVAQYHENSRYYSAVPPAVNKEVDNNLPHITIELPVYKESLKETMWVIYLYYFLTRVTIDRDPPPDSHGVWDGVSTSLDI